MTAPFEFEKLRIGWYKSVVVPCNWKVVVDAFNEAYHAFATHSGVVAPTAGYTTAYGKHGTFTIPFADDLPGREGDLRRTMLPVQQSSLDYMQFGATQESIRAADLIRSLPDGLSTREIYDKWLEHFGQLVEARGAKWPKGLSYDYLANTPTDWHIFPNSTFVPTPDAVLWHRMRPHGDDPAMSVWDIWSLDRLALDTPRTQREFFPSPEAFRGQNAFLEEDFSNMAAVQKGMLSRGFEGGRTNPVQEVSVSNFHKTLYDYLHDKN
jgi:phenylpropionate dioxygenase-like ring-hydroxylating dioxygenase large terminal subunit